MKTFLLARQMCLLAGVTILLTALPLQTSKDSAPFCRESAPALETVVTMPADSPWAQPQPANDVSGLPPVTPLPKSSASPVWAVQYGQEFWHHAGAQQLRSSPPNAGIPCPNLDLGNIIDRVSHAFTPAEQSGQTQVEAKSYSAVLDETGFSFYPYLSEMQPDALVQAHFETLSVQRGQHNLFTTHLSRAPRSILGNTAQQLLNEHAGLVEHYLAGAAGVEVSWILQKPPAGTGPLEIQAELTGLLYAGESSGKHHFADEQGIARLCIGTVALVDAHGTRSDLPMRVEGSTLVIHAPENLLLQAAYPIAIDPLVSPEFDMDTPITSLVNGATDPAVASNGQEYLVVWVDSRGAVGWLLYGTRVSADGMVLDPRGLPFCTNAGVLYPAVASNGRDFLVVWQGGVSGPRQILGLRVSPDGTVLDSNPLAIGIGNGHPRPAVASDGTNYLVAWEHDFEKVENLEEDILAARVTSSGQLLDSPSLVIQAAPNRQRSPALAWNGSVYLLVWDDNQGSWNTKTFGIRLTRDGQKVDSAPFLVGPGVQSTFPTPAVASDGRDFMVALGSTVVPVSGQGVVGRSVSTGHYGIPAITWNGEQYLVVLLENSVFAVQVSSQGAVIGTLELPLIRGEYFNWSRPAVASVLDDCLAVWDDRKLSNGHILGAIVKSDGTVPSRDIPISTDLNSQYQPAVAANGSDFLVVWSDYRPWTYDDIYGVRVSGDGTILDTAAIPFRTTPLLERAPAVASDGQNWFVVWQEYRDSWTVAGRRLSRAGVLLDKDVVVLGQAGTLRHEPAVASNGSDYLVAWSERNNVCAARVRADATVVDPNGIRLVDIDISGIIRSPAVASDGRDYLVAWSELYAPQRLAAARVTSQGTVLNPGGITLSDSGNMHSCAAVAFNGQEYFVLWQETTGYPGQSYVFGKRLFPDGATLDQSPISVPLAPGFQVTPKVASDGHDFLVAWSDRRTQPAQVYAARFTPDGTIVEPNGFLLGETEGWAETGAVLAYNGQNFLAAYSVRLDPGVFRIHGRSITFTLPSPWQGLDIGGITSPSTAYTNGTFVVPSSGNDIWGRQDSLHFVFQPLVGDGQIIARVISMDSASPRAKAGVMLRDGLSPEARNMFMGLTGDSHAIFQTRLFTSWNTLQAPRASQIPAWVRLVRRGNLFIGYHSTDGVNWKLVRAASGHFPETLQAGLAVCSDGTSLNTALFDCVNIVPRSTLGMAVSWDPLAARIETVGPIDASGALPLRLQGLEGPYLIEFSTDLRQWQSLQNLENTSGIEDFVDLDAGRHPQRFYRARLVEQIDAGFEF